MAEIPPTQYEAIIEASPDAILLVDANGVIRYANSRVSGLFGYDPDELAGEPVEVLVPAAVRDEHAGLRDGYLANPRTRPMGADVELSARHKDGSTVPVDISLSPLNRSDDLEVVAVVRDVSEQRAIRAKYRTILESVPDAVVVADAETGEIVEANDHVTDLFGYDTEELLGRSQTTLHPADEADRYRELFETHVAAQTRIFTQLPDGADIVVETKTGEHVPVDINAQVFEFDDRELIAGVFRDVTPRKERDRQLTELHATMRRLMRADAREEIARLVADATKSILGYESNVVRFVDGGQRLTPVAVSEQARADLGPPPDYAIADDTPVSRAYDRDEPLRYDDLADVDDDYDRGAARSAMYLPIGSHGVLSIVDSTVGAFDASDVELAAILAANAETALDRLAYERELERQNRRLTEFASVVSHDIQNPLNVANGWLELAREDASTDAFDNVEEALDRIDQIVTDTLTLARQGQTVAELETIDATAIVAECWGMVSTDGGRVTVADEFRLRADRDRLRHLLENLFRNALEHGGDDVQLTVGAVDGVGFYVEDDGPGIPEAEREHVFELGYTTEPDGTGFGLAIVTQIAQAHGWDVRVTDGASGGARFEFTDVELDR